ncbi:MAG: substrate-binding domain-containing protein [Prevotellaceae bacterium]|jgi:phosphate transport system substrate-binding protein|nr:substrate-binding domain-containing protein [Prevotellaceae bacterium]
MKKTVTFICAIVLSSIIICGCINDTTETPTDTAVTTKVETAVEEENPINSPVVVSTNFSITDFQKVDGSTVTLPLTQLFAKKTTGATDDEIMVNLQHNKTYAAFNNLVGKGYDANGREITKSTKDIIFTTLQSSETIKNAKVEVEITPIAQDGFVFLVNKENPVQSLTKQQIIDIYTGKITNWKQVGGDDANILAYQRQEASGSQDGMIDLVMGYEKISNSVTAIASTMEGLVDSIANYENSKYAIGYSYFYFTTVQYVKESTKLLSIDGVEPTTANFANGSYPLVAKYYAIIRASEPEDSFARKFLQLVLSEGGQRIVEEAGYIKMTGYDASSTSNPKTITGSASTSKIISIITQPAEFTSITWNKYETMFQEEATYDETTEKYTYYYFDVVAWFQEQYEVSYSWIDNTLPSNLIAGSINTINGQVTTYLFNDTIPLKDKSVATKIGYAVIAKVTDIATNPAEYGINIKKTTNPDDFFLIGGGIGAGNYSINNELLIYVERYAFNNIISYSINFFVPTDNYYTLSRGGPWGISCHQGYRFGMNFDAKTGKQITWEDIFADNIDYKTEIAIYQEYRSFIDEMPKATGFNHNKMFLLTPSNILIGDDYNSIYCENKGIEMFDNKHYREFDGAVFENDYGIYAGGDKLVDIKHSEKDMPLNFFKDKIAIFERYKTSDNLWDSSVEIKNWKFPTNTLKGWLY